MQGCVNKTSLFDKDLVFLCIFGLRGDNHELESQIGLRCAIKLRRGLIKFPNVKSVSIGVTTGMTYCGVVGHILRREYTVIGMTVNKAARLMCAYIDKVVCDRESFLLSHLEARHFILQEPKYLKGITNVGPIYEFSEQTLFFDQELHVSKSPLLGRTAELKRFNDLLQQTLNTLKNKETSKVNNNKINALVIRGEPRIGKTRLLEEMTLLVPSEVPVNFIALAPYDIQNPYILLRLIFYIPLDISESTPEKEKQTKFSAHFKESDENNLWLLNQIFNIKFKLTPTAENFNVEKRKKITKDLLLNLSVSCFKKLWIILIDDAEFADEESLLFFLKIATYGNIIFIMAFGNKLFSNYHIPSHIASHSEKIDLEGLHKWYHASVACQVLDVIAIPAELEKAIQERSSGNPGWIESFLICLLQSSAIVIKKLTTLQIHEMGFVTPPPVMLKRTSALPNLEDILDSTTLINCWEMYQSSFTENDAKDIKAETSDNIIEYDVVTLTSNFMLEDFVAESTIDSILLNLFDSLTPLDQLLLKCASVLGEIIDRVLLKELMQGIPDRDFGLSIYKLFELRIMGCAVGDFSRSAGPAIMFKPANNLNANLQIRCGCKRIKISAILSDLPDYASCGSMRFKLDSFRETTYRLLTENQKMEFHGQALRYLQRNTHRCISCGGGNFKKLLGESTSNEITSRKKYFVSSIEKLDDSAANIADNIANDENLQNTSARGPNFKICKSVRSLPTRTFSDVDFTNCECNLNLLTAYTHILEHCRGIGDSELLLIAILEFVEVCLSMLNIPQAMKLLREGDDLIETVYNSAEDELIVLPYLKGKILTLRGRCFLGSGLITEAMTCFDETMRVMKYTFPTNPIGIKLKSFYLLSELGLMLTCLRSVKVGILDGDGADYSDQFASCLAQIFTVYRLRGMQDHARLAAIWGLKAALESNKDFFVLCTSYENMMIIAHNYQYKSIIPHLERDAINLCNERKDTVEFWEVKAIAELYTRIFLSRWLRGITDSATEIGFISVRLARTIRSMSLKLIVLPRIIHLLIMNCRYGEVVPILQELEFISQNDMDQSGLTWYYSLSMDLLLESGVSLITPLDCERFYQLESSKILNLSDIEAATRFYIVMWLWYVRIGDWDSATVWRSRKQDDSILYDYSVPAALTILKKLEGLIISYVCKLDNKDSLNIDLISSDIKDTFKMIDSIQKVVISIRPRYLMMRAYYEMSRYRTKMGLFLLRKSKKLAEKVGDKIVYRWADHCEKSWTGLLSLIQQDHWKEKCTLGKPLDWHEFNMSNWKFIPYTLPIPQK